VASKDHPTESIVFNLLRLTCPVAIVGSHYPVTCYSALVANVATYALAGLVGIGINSDGLAQSLGFDVGIHRK
jgi:hypothetical protein